MTRNELQKLADRYIPQGMTGFRFTGGCHRCGKNCAATIDIDPETGRFSCDGDSAVFQIEDLEPAEDGEVEAEPEIEETDAFALLCDDCYKADPVLTGWRKTEVWQRTVGYYRPVDQMNPGKQAEVNARKTFDKALYGR